MRILVLVPFPMAPDQMALRRAQAESTMFGPGVTFEFRSARVAPDHYVSDHDNLLGDVGMFEAGMNAESEGFDAVCIDTVSDAAVGALRSVLDIPVIGPGRVAMLTAMMLGRRFGIITMWKDWIPLYTKTLKDLGLEAACAGVRAIDMKPDSLNLLSGKLDVVAPLLIGVARALIDQDGAQVLMLGSTTMHQSCAAISKAVAPVPVINPGPLAFKMAETAIALSLTHSRAAYPRPHVDKRAVFKTMLDAAGSSRGPS
jgi:Asp/Glu/hydantoin racemase